jgi:serine/threonine protein kinase
MLGKNLGHYRIREHIGAGGMGVVFLAHDEQLECDVAIKVLPAGASGFVLIARKAAEAAGRSSQVNPKPGNGTRQVLP